MEQPRRILHLEDNLMDAELVAATIADEKVPCDITLVMTPEDYLL